MTAKIGPREAALRAQREAVSDALGAWADDKRRAAHRAAADAMKPRPPRRAKPKRKTHR